MDEDFERTLHDHLDALAPPPAEGLAPLTRADIEKAVEMLAKNEVRYSTEGYFALLSPHQAWLIEFWIAVDSLPTARARLTMMEFYRYETRRYERGRTTTLSPVRELASRAMRSS